MRILFLLLYFPSFLYSQQDWSLFPLQQQTYFQVESEIEEYYCDSIILLENDVQAHYFGAGYLFESFGECTEEIVQEFWVNEDLEYELKVDTIYSNLDSYFSIINQDTLRFFHLTNIGENWEIPTATGHFFRLTLNEIIEETFFNFTDSIKVFEVQYLENSEELSHPLNGLNFKLSKQSGFTQFLPFSTLYFEGEISNIRTLAGMKKDAEIYGYSFDFNNFFHYEVGDFLKWHSDYKSDPGENYNRTEEWFLDTITNIYIDGDFLKLDVNRTIYTEKSNNSGIYENYTDVGINAVFAISKILMDSFLTTPIHHPVPLFTRLRYLRQSPVMMDIGIEETADFVTPKQYFLEDCSTTETADLSGSFKLNSELGFTYTRLLYTEESNYVLELLGYQSGEFLWGELEEIPVAINQSLTHISIDVFPNPASDFVKINLSESLKNAKLSVINSSGRVLLKRDLKQENLISINNLMNGFYSLKIENGGGEYYSKLVVFK